MLVRFLQLQLALAPLAAGLALLSLMPLAAQATGGPLPTTPWRLDPLALAGLALLPIGAARPRRSLGDSLRLSLGVVIAGLALAATAPALQWLLLLVAGVVLVGGLPLRWYAATALLGLATFFPSVVQAAGLPAEGVQTAGLFALMLAALIGLGSIPFGLDTLAPNDWELTLRPVWLFPLLRSYTSGQWPAWSVGLALLAGLAVVLAARSAFVADTGAVRRERVLAAVLGMALVCASLHSAVGIAGTLWVLAAHGLLVCLWGREDWDRHDLGRPVLISIVLWWASGTAAAAGAFLLAALTWLAGFIAAIAALGPIRAGASGSSGQPPRAIGKLFAAVLFACLPLFSPIATRFVALPVIAQLDPGLTA